MSSPPKALTISIDAMGGDHGPLIAVAGAALSLDLLAERTVRFLLHGDEDAIKAELLRQPRLKGLVEIQHTDRRILGDEKPAQALRRGKGSSLWNSVEAIREGRADACVSGGNTGALMAISKLILRMTGGLDRPAIVASWPTARGITDVLDVGANIDCGAAQLVEFALLGEAFHRIAHPGNARPTVGLLNIGSEDVKGHQEVRDAHRILLEGALEIDYRGFVEGDDIAKGTVDVIVTDGFTGNVALKTGEGLARFFVNELRTALSSSLLAKAGAFMALGALNTMRARLEPPGGGPLLGLKGVVVKTHGGATARQFADAVKMAADLAASDYAAAIAASMARLQSALDPAASTVAEPVQ